MNLVRCLLGAGASAVVLPMLDKMGRGWAYTFLGLVQVGVLPLLGAIIWWGPRWRARQRKRDEMKSVKEEGKEERGKEREGERGEEAGCGAGERARSAAGSAKGG